jgi:G3E family GTPase
VSRCRNRAARSLLRVPQHPAPIPVTVVGGYLGAGKTTLVNHLLRHANGVRLGVLVNDFGALQIDAELIEATDGDTVSLTNGCICCSLAGGVMEALQSLAARPQPPDRVIIETSGVSDPVAVAQYAHLPGFRLDAVIVLADAETVRRRSTDKHVGRHVLQQLRGADLVALNKVDLLAADQLAAVRAWLAETAPGVRVIEATNARLPLAVVFDDRPADNRPADNRPADNQPADDRPAVGGQPQHHVHDEHRTWTRAAEQPVDRAAFDAWVAALAPGIVRAKGFVRFTDEPATEWEFQLVGARHRLSRRSQPGSAHTPTRIVLIGLPTAAEPEELS